MATDYQIDLAKVSGTGPSGRIMRRDVEVALHGMVADPVGKVRATPAARHLAQQTGIVLAEVQGRGPRGRIQSADVQTVVDQRTVASNASLSTQHSAHSTFKLTGMRRTIALRLQKSYQTAPHFFLETSIDSGGIESLRTKLKARREKLSVTAILVRVCASVLMKHRIVNATINDDEVTLWEAANIGVAVALDDGLVVPVIHNAEQLSLSATQQKLDELTQRARTNTLHINDVTDGTFTISNLGMYGIDRFTAIINPPQVAILAVGRTQKVFVPDENDQPVLKSFINLVLSADHRVIDGANAAGFLAELKQVLEEPALMVW
ncbi:MAG: 2-oxo acid dehydrogenase subunit E2 [Anaerolineae bacterium]